MPLDDENSSPVLDTWPGPNVGDVLERIGASPDGVTTTVLASEMAINEARLAEILESLDAVVTVRILASGEMAAQLRDGLTT